MTQPELPDWLRASERRAPPKDRGFFLRGCAKALAFVIRQSRREPERDERIHFAPPVKLALTVVATFLITTSQNFAFVATVGVALLVKVASLEPKKLLRAISAPLEAFVASILILAPALLWGQTRAFWIVPIKTLATTTALSLFAQSTNWNRFSCAFKSFGAPDALVFIFDLALKNAVAFGEICLDTIDAVSLRSVGRDRRKARTLGGIAGVAFLRAQDAAQEQFDAMTCRCFSGKDSRFRAPLKAIDVFGFGLVAIMIAAYVYFEYAARCLN